MTTNDFENRRKTWQANLRPEWLEKLNAEGRHMDIQSIVPLDEDSLIAHATANTGLSDFGDEHWREPFRVLIKALNEEAELNLMGRLMTRSDLLLALEARLMIEDCYRQHPEIEDEIINKPMFIIGQGRSGTSMLQNILAEDPNNGIITTWEAYRPCPPPEKATYANDPRIDTFRPLITQINRVIPEIQSMHEFEPELSTENIHIHCLSFMSPAWFPSFGGQVPSYMTYMQNVDPVLIYEYEKRVLKLLQWKNPRRHWVLKSPYCINHLPEILKVYPDAALLWTHRDPVKALSSVVNLIGTLFWARSDSPFIGNSLDMYTNADLSASMLERPIDWLNSGVLPTEQLMNIQYAELVEDPIATIEKVYRYFDIDFSTEARQAMQAYLDANPRQSRPKHQYHAGDDAQVNRERQAFARYQRFFDVPSEQ